MSEQSFNCVFCKETFNDKEQLQVHFRKHGDPSFNAKNRFEKPTPMSSEQTQETGLVNCDVCSQTFPTISKAITHKHKVHPDHDAKYFCPWCGKLFTMKHLYNVHVETTHNNQEKPGECFHCDCCEVDFLMPSAMLYHNKFFHRQEADIPDVGSSKKICLCNQEVIQIYYCAFCGEEYKNKVNLFKHMTDDHSDENQRPDEVLRCPLCEAVFYHLDAYEIHLTFHTTEDMYSVQNPLFNELTDFSLETVQPLFEKVENYEPAVQNEENPESTINSVGIERFLELAMDQSDDGNNIKVKKHKKHKKSKKAAITLDEFLSMNTDVFGEDLDIQGVVEVPTRVVKKQLKQKETKPNKKLSPAEIAKLKKQGIVIKKKPPAVKGFPMKTGQTLKIAQAKIINEKQQSDITNKSSNAMLSKLINQSNNQIRIVKKSSNDNALLKSEKSIEPAREETEENSGHDLDAESTNKSSKTNNLTDELQLENKADNPKNPTEPQSLAPKASNDSSEHGCPRNKNNEPNFHNNEYDGNEAVCPSPERSELKDKYSKHEDKPEITQTQSDPEDEDNCSTFREHESPNEDSHDGNQSRGNCTDSRNVIEASNTSRDSLSHLKHLSHLITVKTVNKNTMDINEDNNSVKNIIVNDKTKLSEHTIESKTETGSNKETALDTIKNLGKNLTIKPVSKLTITDNQNNSLIDEKANQTNVISKELGINKNLTVKKIKVEGPEDSSSDPNFRLNKSLVNVNKTNSISQNNTSQFETKTPKNTEPGTQNVNSGIAEVLKRLPNIQTKQKVFEKPELPPPKTPSGIIENSTKNPERQEEVIEIFDVDDSEDEIDANHRDKKVPAINANPPVVHPKPKPIDALKNLGKHLTIKSVKGQPPLTKVKIEENSQTEHECDQNDFDDMDDPVLEDTKESYTKKFSQKEWNSNVAFQSTTKNMGKNVTITSNNSKKSQSTYQEYQAIDDYNNHVDEASDSDSCPGNVKITELDEDVSDSEFNSENFDISNAANEPIIESPDDSCSNEKRFDDADLESEIKVDSEPICHPSTDQNSIYLNNLNLNKNLTIKSVSKNSQDNIQNNLKQSLDTENQLSQKRNINTFKSAEVNETKDFSSKNLTIRKNMNKSVGQQSKFVNQSMCKASDLNSVNKEVKVETFQTKTVIQEITTTVTKTIKTVNQTQSVKSNVRNTSQSNLPMIPLKVQGMMPGSSKNLQGVVVKNASANVPLRVGNTNLVRPMAPVVRPSKQLTPAKPSVNVARMSNPRMQVAKKVAQPNNPNIGKTLKISPTAMASMQNKRPNTETFSGPFSCFKKPKESLIPGSDLPSFSESTGDFGSQVLSATHTSSSNFTSTMKVAKDNSVMTATQMKSEVSSSSKQINRVCNTAGLTMKASQSTQRHVQEKSESNAMKRNTLEAIQKLQKQGLLIKKPRLENEGSTGSGGDNL